MAVVVGKQAISWIIDGLIYWRIYTSLGISELMHCQGLV